MAFTLTIAGVSKTIQDGTLHLRQMANGRSTLSIDILSKDGTYRPAMGAEVLLAENATTIFGGLIDIPTERSHDQAGSNDAIVTNVNAADYHAYTERRYVNETLAAGTLKAQLTTLVANYLATFGVTLDAGQVNGPSMPVLSYDYKRLDEVLNELATLTADAGEPYVWRISPTKVLRMYQPSTTAAPFNIVGNNPTPYVIGDLEVETTRADYANKIILKVTPKTEAGRTESITGDGTAGPFPLTYTLTHLLYGIMLVQSGGGETLAVAPAASGVQWEYDPVTNSVTRLAGNTVVGEVYSLTFDGVFSGTWTASDAPEIASVGVWERVVVVDSIPSDTTGQAMADAFLAKSLPAAKVARYGTFQTGLATGQVQTINVPRRNINATAVITEIVITDRDGHAHRQITATCDTAQTNLERGWQDVYKLWAGDKTGGGSSSTVSVGSGGATPAGPGLPLKSVQFNDAGAFGGDAEFTYDKDTNCLVMGRNSSITAANPESCLAIGDDCHVADP